MLEGVGLSRDQAETHVQIISEVVGKDMASNKDFDNFKKEMRTEFGCLRAEFEGFRKEMRTEFEGFKKEMRAEFGAFKKEMRTEFETFKKEMRVELDDLRNKFETLKADFDKLRAEFDNLRAEFEAFKKEIREEIKNLVTKDELKTEMKALENRIIIKICTIMTVVTSLLVSGAGLIFR